MGTSLTFRHGMWRTLQPLCSRVHLLSSLQRSGDGSAGCVLLRRRLHHRRSVQTRTGPTAQSHLRRLHGTGSRIQPDPARLCPGLWFPCDVGPGRLRDTVPESAGRGALASGLAADGSAGRGGGQRMVFILALLLYDRAAGRAGQRADLTAPGRVRGARQQAGGTRSTLSAGGERVRCARLLQGVVGWTAAHHCQRTAHRELLCRMGPALLRLGRSGLCGSGHGSTALLPGVRTHGHPAVALSAARPARLASASRLHHRSLYRRYLSSSASFW
mmetsp:Transcript_10853/g.27424  ORF Transcript_10853/g.27424 Transcript_10853/m.27424 type:complete len:273 (+) Transcript_10853:131-949(+)